MSDVIIVAVLSLVGTLSGSYFAQRKSTALIAYRLEQLELHVKKHNNFDNRIVCVEKKCEVYEEKFKVANARISDMEKG